MICTNNIIPLIFKARIDRKRSSSRYFGSFIEILTFHRAEFGGGRVPPAIMNFENPFEYFRMHTANFFVKYSSEKTVRFPKSQSKISRRASLRRFHHPRQS